MKKLDQDEATNHCEERMRKTWSIWTAQFFYSDAVRDAVREWTSNHFARAGACKISKMDLGALAALKRTMRLCKDNNIKDH